MRVCSDCNWPLQLADFHKDGVNLRPRCKRCRAGVQRSSRYGITDEDYQSLLLRQRNRCGICNKPPSDTRALAVDHDHTTGRVRGLLCDPCNTALGLFEDSPDNMSRAIAWCAE